MLLSIFYGFLINIWHAARSVLPRYRTIARGKHAYVREIDTENLVVYSPRGASAETPVFIFLHGGAWVSGAIRPSGPLMIDYRWLAKALASRGVRAALIGYPLGRIPWQTELGVYGLMAVVCIVLAKLLSWVLLPMWLWLAVAVPCYTFSVFLLKQRVFSGGFQPFGSRSQHGPGATVESQWLVINNEYSKLGTLYPYASKTVIGHSAGGQFAALLGTNELRSSRPSNVVLLSGVYDVVQLWHDSPVLRELLLRHVFSAATLHRFSPVHKLPHAQSQLISAGRHSIWTEAPRWFVVSPRHDFPGMHKDAAAFVAKLRQHYDTVHHLQDLGNGHGFGMLTCDKLWDTLFERLFVTQDKDQKVD